MAEQIVGLGALERRLNAVGGGGLGKSVLTGMAMRTVRESKLLVPRKTGNLGRSIHVAETTPTYARVVASAKYADFVEEGTRPHEITPQAAKALRWVAPGFSKRLSGAATKATQRAGGYLYAKVVHHPGTKAHPFLLPGAKAAVAKAGLLDVVVELWNKAA